MADRQKEITCALNCYLILTKVSIQAASCRGNWGGAPGTICIFHFNPIQVIVGEIPVGKEREPCHHLLNREMQAGERATGIKTHQQMKQWYCRDITRINVHPSLLCRAWFRPCPEEVVSGKTVWLRPAHDKPKWALQLPKELCPQFCEPQPIPKGNKYMVKCPGNTQFH